MNQNRSKFSLKKRAKTFYFASLFFSKSIREDIKNIYLFCRYIDDIGDDKNYKKDSKINLNKIKKELKVKRSRNLIISNYINILKKYDIETSIPNDLINGVLSDLNSVNIKTINELLTYSYKVAGTVGLMMCNVMNVNQKELRIKGIQLGMAMQLTNIARDIKEDLERDRVYFPMEFRSKGIKNFNLLLKKRILRKQFSKDLKRLLDFSDIIYQIAWKGVVKLPNKYKLPIAIAAYLYQSIGFKIREREYNIWDRRIYLTKPEKIMNTIKIIYKLFFDKKINDNKIEEKKLNKFVQDLIR